MALILILLPLAIIFIPQLWVRYILKKHDTELATMPFTGGEFGNKILLEENLKGISIGSCVDGDHYDPDKRAIRVNQERLKKKSLTSIVVICHEIGHAIQDRDNYEPFIKRLKLIKYSGYILKASQAILFAGLPGIFALGMPKLALICLWVVIAGVVISTIVNLINLPVEFDASFNKAMPILKKHVPHDYHGSCKSILRACAFTYVAGSIIQIIQLRPFLVLLMRLMFRR